MAAIPDWSHETVLLVEPTSAALAREFVCLHLVAHHLLHLVEDMRLVVSELATNAVAHARTPFIVTLSQTNGSVLLGIQDASKWVPAHSPSDVMDVTGRGLMIVESLSEEWGTSTDGGAFKSVWASFPSALGDVESDPVGAHGRG